ncbi:unnamed protein product [Rangifer tarandus platyrhynchus]|uniref:Uncharacterized protein n=1 Tax=Rangifer tarandus platyrhynchus TaxID=3082113 RepID=A0AC59YJP3_RANTA
MSIELAAIALEACVGRAPSNVGLRYPRGGRPSVYPWALVMGHGRMKASHCVTTEPPACTRETLLD